MARQVGNLKLTATRKKSSQGGRNSQIKLSSMNKSKRRSYKKDRGQGRVK